MDNRNPFRAGAGLPPPHLAGREEETEKFVALLKQDGITTNLILTGLRGTGKTVLLDSWHPVAIKNNWLWVGTDLSESASVSETTIAIRILTDLSIITSQLLIKKGQEPGFKGEGTQTPFDYNHILQLFNDSPGLVSDRLKTTLQAVWQRLETIPDIKGIVFAYDEAQFINDQKKEKQYPLSVLLEVFQSLQKQNYPFLLVLAGLPTIQPRLSEARTYTERMFHVVELRSLNPEASRDAILKPLQKQGSSVSFSQSSLELVITASGGYPYFIQFICREAFDSFLAQMAYGHTTPTVPLKEIIAKLDIDFFAARWQNTTDRERELLSAIAELSNSQSEFAIKEAEQKCKEILKQPLKTGHIAQVLIKLADKGMVYRVRYGKYALSIPMLNSFIKRQTI